ncbi:hypothetical protein K435DRAFT_717657 [Dendrothele bispora CBS 962.96]|uniref:Heme haloperoxidase family profile domain-containing protein n=1 Tax=Dendrothele bispora (strain CBS 962.96) TaxID=1314807 RepID=A0A4S8MI55_DENBC|nr:hypothetical protein K435DRAFT_717657 [Dendrothele bispora CBS 962.96]
MLYQLAKVFRLSLLLQLLLGSFLPIAASSMSDLDNASSSSPSATRRCPLTKPNGSPLKVKRANSTTNAIPIDVSGEHEFRMPQKGDRRGPCPGLNALANHGYLPHSGITTIFEAIVACQNIFGMGPDIGGILSVYATLMDADPTTLSWSIGGPFNGPLGLGGSDGLSGSHNKFESDSSPTRGDAFLHGGDGSTLQLDYFKWLYSLQPESSPGNYDLDVIMQHRRKTFDFSKQNNPNFFYGPAAVILTQASHTFITRLMSNNTENGLVLDKNTLKSFFGVTGNSLDELQVLPGSERIPENWYRRPDDHHLVDFAIDALTLYSGNPDLLKVGGNTGTVNSFTPLDLDDLTGGVYNAQRLTDPNIFVCFMYQLLSDVLPDIIKTPVTSTLGIISQLVSQYILPYYSPDNCPALTLDTSKFGIYPGRQGSGF